MGATAAITAVALIVRLFHPGVVFIHTTTLGSFLNAASCIVDPRLGVVVVDPSTQSITRWASTQATPVRIGGFGWSAGSFDQPKGVAFDGLTLYVADYGNHRIQRFDSGLRFLSALSTHDTADGGARFGYPLDVAITQQGSLLILDGENNRVISFDREGRFERAFGNHGTKQQRLEQPQRLRFWSTDTLLVVEPHRCIAFDVFGNFIREIPAGTGASVMAAARDGQDLVIATRDSIFWRSFDGAPRYALSLASILADEPVRELSDIQFQSENVFVLTSRRLFVFRVMHN